MLSCILVESNETAQFLLKWEKSEIWDFSAFWKFLITQKKVSKTRKIWKRPILAILAILGRFFTGFEKPQYSPDTWRGFWQLSSLTVVYRGFLETAKSGFSGLQKSHFFGPKKIEWNFRRNPAKSKISKVFNFTKNCTKILIDRKLKKIANLEILNGGAVANVWSACRDDFQLIWDRLAESPDVCETEKSTVCCSPYVWVQMS